MIQLSMGYPDTSDEISIVNQHGRDDAWNSFGTVINSSDIISWRKLVDEVSIHEEVVNYIVNCVRKTRQHPEVQTGASPRTGVKISRLTRALALVRGMDFVNIDMIKEVFHNSVSHRLIMRDPDMAPKPVVDSILNTVPVEPR
jgi:MoxR-like ATPase